MFTSVFLCTVLALMFISTAKKSGITKLITLQLLLGGELIFLFYLLKY